MMLGAGLFGIAALGGENDLHRQTVQPAQLLLVYVTVHLQDCHHDGFHPLLCLHKVCDVGNSCSPQYHAVCADF